MTKPGLIRYALPDGSALWLPTSWSALDREAMLEVATRIATHHRMINAYSDLILREARDIKRSRRKGPKRRKTRRS